GIYKTASAFQPYLVLIDQLLSRSASLRKDLEHLTPWVKEGLSMSSSLQREYVETAIPLLVRRMLPFEHRTTIEFKEKFEREFGGWTKQSKLKYPSRNEFEEARQRYVEQKMRDNKAQIEKAKRDFLSAKLRQ